MDRKFVSSTNIRSIGYAPQLGLLEVEFTSGDIYQYFDVPAHVYESFMRASSHGQFLNENIRYNFRYKKVS